MITVHEKGCRSKGEDIRIISVCVCVCVCVCVYIYIYIYIYKGISSL